MNGIHRRLVRRLYVAGVVAAGALLLAGALRHLPWQPAPTLTLLAFALVLSLFKLRLPLAQGNSTMSMAYAVDFVALTAYSVELATLLAAVGVLLQCTVRVRRAQPLYRAAFSMAAVILAVQGAGFTWHALGGNVLQPGVATLLIPLSAAATTYFLVNTGLVAIAISLTSGRPAAAAWQREFLCTAPGYFLSAAVAGVGGLIAASGTYELLPLAASPLYFSYRAYQISVRRTEEDRQHAQQLGDMVVTTQEALSRATESEAALAAEKERLAIESARLAVTLRTISDGVITVDRTGHVLLMNDSARRLTRGESIGGNEPGINTLLEALGLASSAADQALHRVLIEAQPIRVRNEPANEDAALIEIAGTPTRDADGHLTGAVWVVRDVTDAERIEHERSKAARLESLGVLAGGLAHDFNNILMGIVGNLSLAQGMVRVDDRPLATRLASAAAACARARGVTNQLLTFAKGGTPVKTTASLKELVLECSRFALSGSNVAPRFEIAADLWAADVDTVQVGQVVHNLVLNGLQAMPRGTVIDIALQNVDVTVGDTPAGTELAPGRYVCLSVHDRGEGISAENIARIFDPYFTTKKNGTGLGLAISYSIIRAHGGIITVASEPGCGACFTVYLPASERRVHVSEAEPVRVTGLTGSGRVLLMDDDVMVAEVAQEMLEALGYQVVVTASGTEAIAVFGDAERAGQPFDTVILDLTVPGGMGGQEALPHLRHIRADVRAFVTSGYADDAVLSRYRDCGFDAVLPKPFTIPDLRRALAEEHGALCLTGSVSR